MITEENIKIIADLLKAVYFSCSLNWIVNNLEKLCTDIIKNCRNKILLKITNFSPYIASVILSEFKNIITETKAVKEV